MINTTISSSIAPCNTDTSEKNCVSVSVRIRLRHLWLCDYVKLIHFLNDYPCGCVGLSVAFPGLVLHSFQGPTRKFTKYKTFQIYSN